MRAERTRRVIAIDGPAASGKSSVALQLARKLGFVYVNSGAMYRAITWHVLDRGIDPSDAAARGTSGGKHAASIAISRTTSRASLIEGADVAEHLRDVRVNEGVSLVSSVPRVRELLVAQMRAYAVDQDVVMEGRDIGSVVFPDTPYKFYIDASPEIRSRRRAAQGQTDQIAARDRADSSRRDSPLTIAADATVIDSSELSIEQVVDQIIERLKSSGFDVASNASSRPSRHEPLVLGRATTCPWDLGRVFFRFRVVHPERRILEGPVILAMNHQSYLDPPLAGIASGREVYFLARKNLLDVPVLGWVLPRLNVIPVDQEGNDRSALKALIRILKTRARNSRISGRRADARWRIATGPCQAWDS